MRLLGVANTGSASYGLRARPFKSVLKVGPVGGLCGR